MVNLGAALTCRCGCCPAGPGLELSPCKELVTKPQGHICACPVPAPCPSHSTLYTHPTRNALCTPCILSQVAHRRHPADLSRMQQAPRLALLTSRSLWNTWNGHCKGVRVAIAESGGWKAMSNCFSHLQTLQQPGFMWVPVGGSMKYVCNLYLCYLVSHIFSKCESWSECYIFFPSCNLLLCKTSLTRAPFSCSVQEERTRAWEGQREYPQKASVGLHRCPASNSTCNIQGK